MKKSIKAKSMPLCSVQTQTHRDPLSVFVPPRGYWMELFSVTLLQPFYLRNMIDTYTLWLTLYICHVCVRVYSYIYIFLYNRKKLPCGLNRYRPWSTLGVVWLVLFVNTHTHTKHTVVLRMNESLLSTVYSLTSMSQLYAADLQYTEWYPVHRGKVER